MDHIILLIENDPDGLYAYTTKLEQWGASVLAARTPEEALTFVRDMGMAPDIVLADYRLDNGATGDATIAQLRQETGVHIPAIMITAERNQALVKRGAEDDFTVLTKPVQLSRLRPLIESKIRYRDPNRR
jgi:CheY-like chemotaxis protein